MELKSLTIRRTWEGKIEGGIEVGAERGKVMLTLTEEQAAAIVAVVADCLVDVAREVASDLTAQMIDGSLRKSLTEARK
jgi:hypothetical protein